MHIYLCLSLINHVSQQNSATIAPDHWRGEMSSQCGGHQKEITTRAPGGAVS